MRCARQTEQVWNRALAVLNADLPDRALSQTFYTGAYHGLVAPITFNDVDGTYRGQDHQNHPNPGFTKYTALSIWDIYRGEFPFIMLMHPRRIERHYSYFAGRLSAARSALAAHVAAVGK